MACFAGPRVGDDFNRDLGFLNAEADLKPFLEGESRPTVERTAELSGTDVKAYVIGARRGLAPPPVPIGAPGFEPGTSPTRTVRATRLRHAPRANQYA